jgi:hypothetical protein
MNIKDSSRAGHEWVVGMWFLMYYDGTGLGHALVMSIFGCLIWRYGEWKHLILLFLFGQALSRMGLAI